MDEKLRSAKPSCIKRDSCKDGDRKQGNGFL